jgi:hypothetical protein
MEVRAGLGIGDGGAMGLLGSTNDARATVDLGDCPYPA